MKTNYLLGSLYLVPVLAAPVFHTSTMLVAGTSARTVFTRPGHRAALVDDEHQVVFDNRPLSSSSSSTKTANVPPTSILDTDRPLTTEDLMALSSKTTAAAAASNPPASHRPAGDRKVTISVGTLVVPGSRTGSVVAQLFDPKSARPYLVPGYYVPSQRADIWVVGMIAVFVLVMVGLESWDLLASVYVSVFPISFSFSKLPPKLPCSLIY